MYPFHAGQAVPVTCQSPPCLLSRHLFSFSSSVLTPIKAELSQPALWSWCLLSWPLDSMPLIHLHIHLNLFQSQLPLQDPLFGGFALGCGFLLYLLRISLALSRYTSVVRGPSFLPLPHFPSPPVIILKVASILVSVMPLARELKFSLSVVFATSSLSDCFHYVTSPASQNSLLCDGPLDLLQYSCPPLRGLLQRPPEFRWYMHGVLLCAFCSGITPTLTQICSSLLLAPNSSLRNSA